MKTIHFLIFFMTVSFVSACEILGSKSENGPSEDLPLVETTWWLKAFQNEDGKKKGIGSMQYNIFFTDSTRVSGKTWRTEKNQKKVVNTYFGLYTKEDSTIKIDNFISTLVGEPQGSKSTEYYIALHNTTFYEINGNRLIIFHGEDRRKALVFTAGEEADSSE